MMEDENQPLVTIAIANYNYAKYVGEAIESVLNQTYSNIELIVIDDGSTDRSLDVIKRYRSKLKLVSRNNKGVVYTRNEALSLAEGELFIFLDADNKLPNDYISKVVEHMLRSDSDVVYTDMDYIGNDTGRSFFPDFDIQLLKQFNFIDSNTMIRLSKVNRTFDEKLESLTHEDWDFFIGLAMDGLSISKCKTTRFNYRTHRQSVSRNSKAARGLYLKMINYIVFKYVQEDPEYLASSFDFMKKSIHDTMITSKNYERVLDEHREKIETLESMVKDYHSQVGHLTRRIEDMEGSKTWRVAKLATRPSNLIKRVIKR